MKGERLKILELLEAGTITADEAVKLLEAMKAPGKDWDKAFIFDCETVENVEEKLNRFTKGVDSFARDLGSKMEAVYKDVEPKLKKASQAMLEKTASVFDDISKSLHETLENARAEADGKCCEESSDCCCGSDDEPKEN